jgi:hypothetical protein
MTVKIIAGAYGHKPEGAKCVTPIYAGSTVTLPDAEAARLIKRGVAVEVVATAPEPVSDGEETVNTSNLEVGNLDPEQLSSMKVEELKALAENMGVDVSGCKKRDEYIAAISAEPVCYDPLSVTDPSDAALGIEVPEA